MADQPGRCKLEERVRELEAEVAELRGDGVLPVHVVAWLENLARDGVRAAADTKSDNLIKACCWLLQALDEGAPVSDVIGEALMVVWHWGERRGSLLKRVSYFKKKTPKWSSAGEWFDQMCERASKLRKPGQPSKVHPMVVMRLLDEGLRGNDLKDKICDETGADTRAAWRAIARHKEQGGLVILFKRGEDGEIVVRTLPPY